MEVTCDGAARGPRESLLRGSGLIPAPPLSRVRVLQLAWPIVLAQAATALTGVVDTAVMGSVGTTADLGAVAVASVTFSFLYWGFGFLRMSTTGLTAQAAGRDDPGEARATLIRALALGAAFGLGLFIAFPLLRGAALLAFQASPDAEFGASAYMGARIFGAPAALMGFAVNGWLLGMGKTRSLLIYQVVLNGLNAVLDATFVSQLGWGPWGIGAGTAIAEWFALMVGLYLVRDGFSGFGSLWRRSAIASLFVANRDIAIRTLALLFGFGWFVNAGALVGPANLAGNQVLLQFVAVAAFVLDAFAFIAEKEAGEAIGSGDRARLVRAIRLTTELALGAGALFSLGFFLVGRPLLHVFVTDPAARDAALAYLPYCAVVPLLGVPAYQLDGIFLGATRGRALRTAALVSTAGYISLDLALRPSMGNTGVWLAFLGMYLLRASALGVALPALLEEVRSRE